MNLLNTSWHAFRIGLLTRISSSVVVSRITRNSNYFAVLFCQLGISQAAYTATFVIGLKTGSPLLIKIVQSEVLFSERYSN